ncbi:MAG: mechanosensitive ion channel family protein [Lachnospiraceae bacterium]|nr:mechanosensitive ion channel family protein [Lachnospiraceae bacterium]
MQEFLDTIVNWATKTGVKIIIALIILFIAFKIINAVAKRFQKKFQENPKYDKTLTKTFINIGKVVLKILVVICLIGYLGIETSGVSALIASVGVAAGLAINGTLANLAGGIMILITRPFKIDDFISAQGESGVVEDIKICYTKVKTVDNKTVYLPNGALSAGTIINYSEKEIRRVDLDFSVAGNDPAKVQEVLLDVCKNEKLVLKDPEPFARVTDYGAGNGMKITLRAWCNNADYWDTYFNLLDGAKAAFDENQIVVPFDQLDVHIKND